MSATIESIALPTMLRGLTLLDGYLVAAQDLCERRKIDESSILNAKLAPDMFPLVRQVQAAADNAKNGVARLAGVDAPRFPVTEGDFDALRARVAATFEFLESLPREYLAVAGERSIDQSFRGVRKTMPGAAYLLGVLVPNFYFHVFMVYGILLTHGAAVPPPPSSQVMDAVYARFEAIHTGGS